MSSEPCPTLRTRARRATAFLIVLPFVFVACGGASEVDETASDIATLESSAPSDVDREEAAEPTTSAAPEPSTASEGSESADEPADEPADASATATETTTADDGGNEGDSGEPLSEDDAQDILNDFSACMRTEGYDDFPDIVVGGGGARQIMDAGIDPREDGFSDAFEVCGDDLDQLQTETPELSPEEILTAEAALLAGAVCMRESGFENFPDPDFSLGYSQQAYVPGLLASGIDIMSPEFRDAGQECSRRVTDEFDLGDN